MGQPGWWRHQSSLARERRTQGTETSQYLEEEKSIEMPQVAASERGSGLNRFSLRGGVVGPTEGMQSCQWKSPGTGRQRR
jgi:hypothetical protein